MILCSLKRPMSYVSTLGQLRITQHRTCSIFVRAGNTARSHHTQSMMSIASITSIDAKVNN